jgi:Family of unknown function (DUF5681)
VPENKMTGNKISENKRDYAVGRGKPPVHTQFKKGQSGNPRGPRPKNLPALLVEALNDKVVVTIDGERREITKREAVATQLVNKSTGADLRATSVGGVLTGRGADLIIIDDPLKPEEALSETQPRAANEWFNHTLYSRLIMHRLHEDDLVGQVLAPGRLGGRVLSGDRRGRPRRRSSIGSGDRNC